MFEGEEEGNYISLPRMCSSYTVEVFAIRTALKMIINKLEDKQENIKKNIMLFSDSQAALQVINNNTLNIYQNRYILDIKSLHNIISNIHQRKINYIWIPAHKGITGNEDTDQMAKAGAMEQSSEEIEVPIKDTRKSFKKKAWKSAQKKVTREARWKGKFYFENFYKQEYKTPSQQSCGKILHSINRIRANHCNLNASLARKDYIDNERCECGYEKEAIDDLIWQCHTYDENKWG